MNMSFINEHSHVGVKEELDLFTLPHTQTSVEFGQVISYYPVSNISDTGPIEFSVESSGDEYIDLRATRLAVRVKIVNQDGTDLAPNTKVGPTNMFMHSLFSQVDVHLNERLVSSATQTYPYRAYIETLANYDIGAKQSQLTMALFYKDTPGQLNSVDPVTDPVANKGLAKRYELTKESQSCDMISPLHADIFFQDRLLLNGVNLKVKLTRQKTDFALLSDEAAPNFKIVVQEASLKVRKVKVTPTIMYAHAEALKKTTAKYPITRCEIKTFSLPRGIQDDVRDRVFQSALPDRIVLAFVDSAAYNGNMKLNPFNLEHLNLNFLAVYLDGRQIPQKPLTPKFDSNGGSNYIQAYETLFSGTQKSQMDMGNDIAREDFPRGYAMYIFDLTPDLNDGSSFNLVRNGNLRIEARFATPLDKTVNLLVYGQFSNVIEIDQARNIIYDFA